MIEQEGCQHCHGEAGLDRLETARKTIPEERVLSRLAGFFRVFGDPTRIKILMALYTGELCVCDLTEIAGVSQSAVSHQLRVLRDSSLVKYRREGKTLYYSLDDFHIEQILRMGTEHVNE